MAKILLAPFPWTAVLLSTFALILWLLDRRWHIIRGFITEKHGPLDLAVARVVVFSLLISGISLRSDLLFAGLDKALLEPPIAWGHFIRYFPMSPHLVQIIFVIFVLATCCALVGFVFRWAAVISVIASSYLYSIPQLWGKVNHTHHLLLFATIMSLSPAADVFSVDAWIAKRRHGRPPVNPTEPTLRHAYALKAIMVILCMVYLFPGIWKLSSIGLDWFTGEHLRLWLARKLTEFPSTTALQRWVMATPTALALGATFTIAFEVGVTFLVLIRRLRPLAVIGGLIFHNSTWILMGIPFVSLQLSYLILVEWSLILTWFRARFPRRLIIAAGGYSVSDDRVPVRLRFASIVLFAGMVLAGVFRLVNSWPIACYPTFDGSPSKFVDATVIDATDASGKRYTEDLSFDRQLGATYSPERWSELASQVKDPHGNFAPMKAKALIKLWQNYYHYPELVRANFYQVTFEPAKGEESPERNQFLGSLSGQ